MVRKTVVELVDDVNGGKADQTISFALDGVAFEIDLSDENAAQLRKDIAQWADHGRRTGGRRQRGTGTEDGAPTSRINESALIRQWASENGIEVSERGRISAEVQKAYAEAH